MRQRGPFFSRNAKSASLEGNAGRCAIAQICGPFLNVAGSSVRGFIVTLIRWFGCECAPSILSLRCSTILPFLPIGTFWQWRASENSRDAFLRATECKFSGHTVFHLHQ